MKKPLKQEPAQLDLWGGKEEFPWEEYRDFKTTRKFVRSLELKDR